MFHQLQKFCASVVPFEKQDLDLIDKYFTSKTLKKRELLIEEGKVCQFLAFISKGSIRHYHILDGNEKTCDISFENQWVTDFKSFTNRISGSMNLQAMEDTVVFCISRDHLESLYQESQAFETFGRIMTEQVAHRATEIAMSLSANKPEQRYLDLIENRPDMFQRIPQKYIANFIGISPESLSRIQKRVHQKQKS
ncbi:Crp/Fnr family transcriptional regulator [bacterium SCSIO 12643]|nr:Crp/Fnr family transcriptional regulator [bacterium SCSIO 12643]